MNNKTIKKKIFAYMTVISSIFYIENRKCPFQCFISGKGQPR
jgi:hypothetical protein